MSSLSVPRLQSETGIGGVKTYRTLEGGGIAPKVAPRTLGLLDPKLAICYRISVERGQFRGPLEIRNFHPSSASTRWELKSSFKPESMDSGENPAKIRRGQHSVTQTTFYN